MGYTRQALKGISWVWALSLVTRSISFFRTIFLARLLAPEQFGTYGIALLTLAMLEILTETGVNVFLVQRRDEIDKYLNTAWVLSILRGTLIFLLMLLVAPLISYFFNSPSSLNLIYLFSLVPLVRGFINPAIVKFQKELNFDKELWFRSAVLLFDTITTILVVLYTKSLLGLAVGLISASILEVFLSFLTVVPRPYFKINRNYLSLLLDNGKWITLSGIFNYLYHNLDDIVVGRSLGIRNLGYYQMAYNISMLPITDIADVVSRVTFPVYALISNEKKRLKTAFFKSLMLVSGVSILFGTILLLFADRLVLLILGEKWINIVDVLRVLVMFGIIRAISGSSSALFLSVGKQKYVTVVTFVSLAGLAATILPLTSAFGIYGAGLSTLVGAISALPFMIYFTYKVLR